MRQIKGFSILASVRGFGEMPCSRRRQEKRKIEAFGEVQSKGGPIQTVKDLLPSTLNARFDNF